MNQHLTIKRTVHFNLKAHGRRRLDAGEQQASEPRPPGRVPRAARLMALAIRLEQQVRNGELASYAEVALLGHVTRARISQVIDSVG
jgi:hypothetical protein